MSTSFDYLSVFFAVFWKSGVALGAALCVNRLLRNRSADVRRLVLSTAVGAIFIAAAALPVLPSWTAVMPLWFQAQRPATQAVPEQPAAPTTVDADADPVSAETRPVQPPARPLFQGIDLRHWLIPLLWFAGTTTLLLRFAINLRGLHRLRAASEPVTHANLLTEVARSGRRVELWRNEAIGAPVTWGIVRPIILVPPGFEEMPAECRDAVLCHELAHIQAHDFLIRGLAEIARADLVSAADVDCLAAIARGAGVGLRQPGSGSWREAICVRKTVNGLGCHAGIGLGISGGHRKSELSEKEIVRFARPGPAARYGC
jgi:beta-lactamase regulating signal transducer with metallopeptidase domain